jgi:hypothetical protein
MPTVPMLPPDQMARAQASAGAANPVNFLIAAADMHNQGQLSAPSGPTNDPLARAGKKPLRKMQVVK